MRRYVLLTAAVAPILAVTAAVSVPGCAEEFDDVCAFLEDSSNCYADFHADVLNRCGAPGAGNGPSGQFASRETLDICFLREGGQVVFDPPLDIAAFPPKSIAFKRLDAQAQECGAFTYSGEFSYSVTINPCVQTGNGTGAGGDGGGGGGADGIGGAATIPQCENASAGGGGAAGGGGNEAADVDGGAVTVITPEGRATLDLSCSEGTQYHFNRLEAETKCGGYDALLPRAILKTSLGKQPPPEADPNDLDEYNGFISFSIHYPPIIAPGGSEGTGGGGDGGAGSDAVPSAEVVEYFNCEIPAALPLCFNGVKDGTETDIDCGGALCKARCGDGQSCIRGGDDCSDGLECLIVDGFSKCTGPTEGTGTGGSGGAGGADGTGGAGGADGQ
ncbi:hypothetical protein WMF11_28245 [Sorangium sp. So ce295]|uniref:hypothetical protein n=1 Tax=Sorangium sp. So ce295 TaxID=3133295 RepID=UPI003F604E52